MCLPGAAIAQELTDHHIGAVPAVEGDGTPLGIVSEGNPLFRPEIGTEKPSRSWWLNLWRAPSDLAEEIAGVKGVVDHRALRSNVRTMAP